MSYPTYFPAYGYNPAYTPQSFYQPPRQDMQGQGYPQMQQTPPAQPQSQPQGFLTRPVTSREEAVAVQVDFMGAGTLMPDLKHGAVYLKRFNPETGACDFLTFTAQPSEPSEPAPPAVEYATKQDLLEMQDVVQGLAADINRMRQGVRGGKRLEPDE